MTRRKIDNAQGTVNLGDGVTETFELESDAGEKVFAAIDGGGSSYTVTVKVWNDVNETWVPWDDQASTDGPPHIFDIFGNKVQVTLENTSGGNSDFDYKIATFKDGSTR